jgi:hypothetical protein
MMNHIPRLHFNEGATRDGFQIEPAFIPTDAKAVVGRIRRVTGAAELRQERP